MSPNTPYHLNSTAFGWKKDAVKTVPFLAYLKFQIKTYMAVKNLQILKQL